jgi:serine/threonine-protein kinase
VSSRLQPGDRYGRFEILDRLGEGGFGTVFKVRDPRYAEPLALKLSHGPIRGGDAAQRALREVTVLRSTNDNPHVVRILDAGLERDGHIFVLMEYLQGLPLDQFHDFDQPLLPKWACHIAFQICQGLRDAHAEGIVHRDIKPANVFIDRQGYVKLLDFGLARSWDRTSIVGRSATVGHMLVGTPHYAQPEQLDTTALTPAADVYSIGLILYELLTGFTPFVPDQPLSAVVAMWYDNPLQWLRAHAQTPVVPLRTHVDPTEVSDDLAHVVDRCLDKVPDERPQNALALAEMLRQAWPP